jgi:hypothetical protein
LAVGWGRKDWQREARSDVPSAVRAPGTVVVVEMQKPRKVWRLAEIAKLEQLVDQSLEVLLEEYVALL